MNEIIKVVIKENEQVVSARELHEKLGIKERFSLWWERNVKSLNLKENTTYCRTAYTNLNNQTFDDFAVYLDIAKHICMVSGGEKAWNIRDYFIELERAWNTPEMVMARALKMADGKIKILENKIEVLTPKAELAAHLFESDDTIDMLKMAKVACKKGIKIGRNNLLKLLRSKNILMADNQPYQKYIEWFEVIEQVYDNGYSVKISFKPLVTPKGQDGIIRLLKKVYCVAKDE